MRRTLHLALTLHWLGVFALLAATCALEPVSGIRGPLAFLGADAGISEGGGVQAAALFGVAFALTAMLFLLAFAELVAERRTVDFAPAYAAAAASLTLLLLFGALHPAPDLVTALETVLAAALASFVAVAVGDRAPVPDETDSATGEAARRMALRAAHTSALRGLSGRGFARNRLEETV